MLRGAGAARRLGPSHTRGLAAAASGSQRILYRSTRGGQSNLTFSEAVLQGLGTDKGLLVPQRIPTFTPVELESWRGLSFDKLANKVRWGARVVDGAAARSSVPHTQLTQCPAPPASNCRSSPST